MAKPNPQTGHGSFGGAEDESALAHGETSRGDAEGDGTEADWDIPAAPDNSPLSRILGLVLVVVLAGVFTFVAYRKYEEARHNPTANQTVADAGNTAPGDSRADANAAPPANEGDANGRRNPFGATTAEAPKPGSFAQTPPNSADAFGSLDEHGPSRVENDAPNGPKHDHHAPGAIAVTQTRATGNANPSAAREAEANPFSDLNSSPERPAQSTANLQAPAQGEPTQQFAGGPSAAGLPSKSDANGGPHRADEPHAPSAAAADADMQNLFPNEGPPKHDRPAQNSQNVAAHGTTLEPAGMTRTAQLQDQPGQLRPAQIQPGQIQPGQVQVGQVHAGGAPTQSEPLDNESLDESRSPAHPAAGERGVAHMQGDSHGPKPEAAMAGVSPGGAPTVGRAEALLGSKERTPSGDDSPFGNGQSPARASQRATSAAPSQVNSTSQAHSAFSPLQASSTPNIQGADSHPQAGSDDPFGGNRSSGGKFAERSGTSPSGEGAFSQPGRPVAAGSVTAAGTTNDGGDYYVVQPQDNFWNISRKKYGNARYFQALAEVNKARIPEPGRMRPGMKVNTPPVEFLEEHYAQFLPPGTKVQVTAAEDATAKAAPTGFTVTADGTPKYRTGENDTLSDIAAKHLGRSSRWIQIYEMNRDKLSNPNQLKVGTELILPGDASSVGLSNEDNDRR
jgi:hypothetical protein